MSSPKKNKILLFNPRAAEHKPRIPNSVLQVAASIDRLYDWVIVDGNLECDAFSKILSHLESNEFGYFGCTTMPGPQLKQAIPFSKIIREKFPNIKIIWGGYFPSNQPNVVLNSGFVDFIINGPGDKVFPELIDAFENNTPYEHLHNLIFKKGNEIVITPKDEIYEQDSLPALPYEKLNNFYNIKKYLGKTFLGTKTIAYHSSFGCPFTCSFCAVVPIYNARWKGKSAQLIYNDIKYLKEQFGGNAIEFHDNNFFVSEKRTVEFSQLVNKEKMIWWGEGRIDTIDKYSDESLATMRESGCKMIFFGAETGNDAILKKMDKGGTQTGAQIKKFAARMKRFDIIPEYSFVLGTPADTEEEVNKQIDEDINFIRTIKEINPDTEIIIYVLSPVPTEGSELYEEVKQSGFHFPEKLEDWISPQWENFDLRKNPLTPWLKPSMIDKIKNFETVLNGYHPTLSDIKLTPLKRNIISAVSSFRYKLQLYDFPYEIKALQKFWLKYRQPELEGF
ncbi:MAG: B12-binding domain-containing radical SAM protein [Ignavibacteria bacterium]|nr:B12-binding domain-containing radical SAM protein [Ignavibacteria bacterium]